MRKIAPFLRHRRSSASIEVIFDHGETVKKFLENRRKTKIVRKRSKRTKNHLDQNKILGSMEHPSRIPMAKTIFLKTSKSFFPFVYVLLFFHFPFFNINVYLFLDFH